MGILVVGMSYEFAQDVGAFAGFMNYALNIERKRHKIYHLFSEVVDFSMDVKLANAGQIEFITRNEKEMYVMGGHFGRCLYDYGKMCKQPRIVLNLSLLHKPDTWKKELKKNRFPLYLWGHKGFEKL